MAAGSGEVARIRKGSEERKSIFFFLMWLSFVSFLGFHGTRRFFGAHITYHSIARGFI